MSAKYEYRLALLVSSHASEEELMRRFEIWFDALEHERVINGILFKPDTCLVGLQVEALENKGGA